MVRPRPEAERLEENRTLRNSEEKETNAEVWDSMAKGQTRVCLYRRQREKERRRERESRVGVDVCVTVRLRLMQLIGFPLFGCQENLKENRHK